MDLYCTTGISPNDDSDDMDSMSGASAPQIEAFQTSGNSPPNEIQIESLLQRPTKESLQDYQVKPISKKEAQEIQVTNHYLHRKASCSFAFGLFNPRNEIKGVILYGSPASPNVARGVCGTEEALSVIELTRLWIADEVPKNGESFLISHSLKLVPKEIIVSYAEIGAGHVGTVYQATNWIYTGLTAKRTNWDFGDNGNKHNRSFTAKYSSEQLRQMFGDQFKLVERPPKHRYIFFNAGRIRRNQLNKKLKYIRKPYPKRGVFN